jgi:biotin-dependent carboxylase-like uncharacterized protein
MSLSIVDAGLETRVVDFGRPASRRLGVPVGGAADHGLLSLGNSLMGNEPDAAALEFAVKGPTLRAECDVGFVVVGPPFAMHAQGRPLSVGQTFNLRGGEELSIGGTPLGVRAYLCVAGGLEAPIVLKSRSSLTPLRKGDAIGCRASHTPLRRLHSECPFLLTQDLWTLHITEGPQRREFAAAAFSGDLYKVSSASNRMGLRLDGPALRAPDREMVSEPVSPGSIQVTRAGQPIVLGVDGQTIGGYPKIAQVIDADLDLLGRMRAGDCVRLVWVDFAAAERLWRQRADSLAEWRARIEISLAGP